MVVVLRSSVLLSGLNMRGVYQRIDALVLPRPVKAQRRLGDDWRITDIARPSSPG
jgi:hypothetical protein